MNRPNIEKNVTLKGITPSTIYTRKGDAGTTALRTGERRSKNNWRIQALGAVDELNCWLGFVRVKTLDKKVDLTLAEIQQHLFVIQAMLANPQFVVANHAGPRPPKLPAGRVKWLEQRCDWFDAQLPPLKNFILPGGSAAGAALHLSRTVCRRAERTVVTLHEAEPVPSVLLKYLNRLSDLIFILARFENRRARKAETAPSY